MPNYTNLVRHGIPENLHPVYAAMGWSPSERMFGTFTWASRQFNLEGSDSGVRPLDVVLAHSPIETIRASIRRPIGYFEEACLLGSLIFDSIDKGVVQAAHDRTISVILSQHLMYRVHKLEAVCGHHAVTKHRFACRVYGNFDSAEHLKQYERELHEYLLQVHRGHIVVSEGNDFWWDTRNHVLFSFDKMYMANIHQRIQASIYQRLCSNNKTVSADALVGR